MENGSLANIIKPNKFGPFPESLVAVYIAQVCSCSCSLLLMVGDSISSVHDNYIYIYTYRCWRAWFIFMNKVLSIGILKVQTY